MFNIYHWRIVDLKERKGGKDQESIQSSTTPDPGYQLLLDKLLSRKVSVTLHQ